MKIDLKAAMKLQPIVLHTLGVGKLSKAVTLPLSNCWRPPKTLLSSKILGFRSCRTMASTSPLCHEVKERIELSESEKKIFDRLLGTLRHFGLQTQLRVAGGWVRISFWAEIAMTLTLLLTI